MADSDARQRQGAAVQELALDEASRKRFLKTMGAGGAGALSLLIAACGGSGSKNKTTATATAAQGSAAGDLKILNYALTLEYLETAFYKDVIGSGLLKGSQLDTIKRFGSQEAEHVTALTAAIGKLGGTPAPAPKTKFPLDNPTQVLTLASTVENLGAAAYLGQAPNIQGKDVLAAALSIHSVEGRHAATLDTLLGKTITPDGAFAKPASMSQVTAAVKPFIVS